MGFKVVQEGEQALIFSRGGQGRLVIGPRRVSSACELAATMAPRASLGVGSDELSRILHAPQVYLFSQEIEYLERRVATQTQYLIVKHRDGRKEHITG